MERVITTERRHSQRGRCLFGAFIAYDNLRTTQSCSVRNMSEQGALLTLAPGAMVPSQFELHVQQLEGPVQARISWSDGVRYGISFDSLRPSLKPSPITAGLRPPGAGLLRRQPHAA